MMMSMYSAVSGLKSQQTKLNVIGNNVANINTLGYKGQSVGFSDLLSQTISSAGAASGTRGGTNAKQIGLGSQVASISTNMSTGSSQYTGNDTDAALSGAGFFVVQGGGTGKYQFTRAGNFGVDVDGNLVVNGMKVCGWNNYSVDGSGNVTYNTQSDVTPINVFGTTTKTITKEAVATNGAIATGTLNATSSTGTTTSSSITAYNSTGASVAVPVTYTNQGMSLALTGALDSTTTTATDTATTTFSVPTTTSGTNSSVVITFTPSGTAGTYDWSYTVDGGASVTGGTYVIGAATTDTVTVDGNDVTVDFSALTGSTTSSVTAGNLKSTWGWNDGTNTGTIVFNPLTGTITSGGTGATTVSIGGVSQPVSLYFSGLTGTGGAANAVTMVAGGQASGEKTVTVNKKIMSPEATTAATLSGNLDTSTTSATSTLTMYDSLGSAYEVKVKFTQTGTNTWTWAASSNDTSISVGGSGTIVFNSAGTVASGSTGSILVATTNGSDVISTQLNLSGIGQYATSSGTSNVSVASIDGYDAGTLQDFSIGTDGIIMGAYSNGQKQPLGDVGLAVFTNPSGLEKIGENLYTTTVNSGDYTGAVEVGTGGAGGLTTGALEMSNVDLASEFSEMMITQRAYQANSKIITTSDTLLETLINMSR